MTGVMGFLAQCAVCPQRALLTDQVEEWLCPRCTDVANTAVDDVKAESWVVAGEFPTLPSGDRVAVELPDGRLFVGCWDAANRRVDLSAPDPLPRAMQIMGEFVDCVESLGEDASPIATATAESVADAAAIHPFVVTFDKALADYESDNPELGWCRG